MTTQTSRSRKPRSRKPLVLAIALVFSSGAIRATTITVTSSGDPGDSGSCTLRQAITSANTDSNSGSTCAAGSGADTIVFDPGLTPSTVTLSGSALSVASELTIDGGSGWDIRANTSLYGSPPPTVSRVLDVSGATLTLNHLRLSNGYGESGACIEASSSNLTLSNTTVTTCYTDYHSGSGEGGAIELGASTLTLDHATVAAGISGDRGGLISATGSQIIATNSTLNGGDAFYLGIGGAVALESGSSLMLVDSVVNSGFARYGGLIELSYSTMTAVNSTLTGGSSRDGDAVGGYIGACGAIEAVNASLTMVNSTVSGNYAFTYGGAICARSGSSVTLQNTIVSGNSVGAGGSNPDIFFDTYGAASTVSVSHSLLGTALQSHYGGNGNQYSDTPMLDSLQDNGGPTRTMALLSGSSALDNGDPALALAPNGVDVLNFDQRGRGFPRQLDGAVDIGAWQHQGDRIFADGVEAEP